VLRRDLLLAATGALASACSRRESASRAAAPATSASTTTSSSRSRLLEWDVSGVHGPDRVAVVVPTAASSACYPLLIALHGRGEALKSPADGALGWPRDYALLRAIDRVSVPPLVAADYEGVADPARVEKTNADLAAHPYGGLVIACPHIPDLSPNGDEIPAVARYLVDVVVPRCRVETTSCTTATGIDGVSMGGALALRVGLSHPETFGAVGALQAAIALEHVEELTELAVAARTRRPALKLRLLTSSGDYFRDAIIALSGSWRAAGVAHDFADVPGPHDYIFNRGPGSIELLTWHDRALR
jgi:pimeloyl-ACP methyl ester carboxylesterase